MSLKSLKDYITTKKGKEPKSLFFHEITKAWLTGYESYMINDLGRSRTTVSMYLRALRTIFNTAIGQDEIDKETYPFGNPKKDKLKYKIPNSKNIKKALSNDQLKILLNATTDIPEQQKARDFWFFSYCCNGMNIKDIALLKWENLQDDKLVFYRAKTQHTTEDETPIIVYINELSARIIENYSNADHSPKGYIFPILSDALSEVEKFRRVKNFTKFINQNLKKLAVVNGLSNDISTYFARHSFATNAVRGGASMEYVSEALGHSDLRTTKSYFKGFEDKIKKQISDNLINF